MRCDQAVARVHIGRVKHRVDLLQRHADGAKTPYDLRRRYLVGAITQIAGTGVDRGSAAAARSGGSEGVELPPVR